MPQDERGPVPISGYLFKMKASERVLTPQWTKRFFALEGCDLKYYHHESSSEAAKVIPLLSIESVRRFENGDHGVFRYASYVVSSAPIRSHLVFDLQGAASVGRAPSPDGGS